MKHNGYFLSKGKSLKDFKLQFGTDINVGTKTTVIGLFNYSSIPYRNKCAVAARPLR